MLFMSCDCHAFASVHCCLVVTCWERADLLALVCDVYCGCAGFALGFIFLSPPFSPIRFFLCHFLKLRARFLAIFRQKKSQALGHFSQKSLLSLTPLILVDYSILIQ